MKARRAVAVGVALAGLAIFVAGPMIQPAVGAPIRWMLWALEITGNQMTRAPSSTWVRTLSTSKPP